MTRKLNLDNLPGVVMAYINVDDKRHQFRNGRDQFVEVGKDEVYLEFDSGRENFTKIDILTHLSNDLKTGSIEDTLRKHDYGNAIDITRYMINKSKNDILAMTTFRLMPLLYFVYAYHLGTYNVKPFSADFRVQHSGIIAEMEMYFLYAGYGLFSPITKTYPEAETVMKVYYDDNVVKSIDTVLRVLKDFDNDDLIEICKKSCFYEEYLDQCVSIPDSEILKDWKRIKELFASL